MSELNETQFGKLFGISQPAVNRYLKEGRLFKNRVKKIDTDDPRNAEWITERLLKPNRELDSSDLHDGDDLDADELLAQLEGVDITRLSKANIDRIRGIEQTLKIKVDRQKTRGELIDRGLVQAVFSKLYTIDTNELRTLGAKLAPEIAGMVNVEDTETLLRIEQHIDTTIMKSLSHIKKLFHDFLVNHGEVGL